MSGSRRDTTTEAEAVLRTTRRGLDPGGRLLESLDLSESLRLLALERLRATHPELTERQLVALLVYRRFGLVVPAAGS